MFFISMNFSPMMDSNFTKKTSRRNGRDAELMGTFFIWFFHVRQHPGEPG